METQELNHKATARQKERPERWVGWYELPQPPLAVRGWKCILIWRPGREKQRRWIHRAGGLWKCYRKWENMSTNRMKEWKQSQNGFGFVTVSSGNIAVGGLWLQEARKWTQTFLSFPTVAGVNQGGITIHVEGWIKVNPDYRGLTTTMACWCQCVDVKEAWSMCRAEGQDQRWWEEKNRGFN